MSEKKTVAYLAREGCLSLLPWFALQNLFSKLSSTSTGKSVNLPNRIFKPFSPPPSAAAISHSQPHPKQKSTNHHHSTNKSSSGQIFLPYCPEKMHKASSTQKVPSPWPGLTELEKVFFFFFPRPRQRILARAGGAEKRGGGGKKNTHVGSFCCYFLTLGGILCKICKTGK